MANESTLTTLTELKVSSTLKGLAYLYNEDVWGPLVKNVVIPMGSTTHILPYIATPTASSNAGEATGATAQALTSSGTKSITVIEHVKQVDLTNHSIYQIPQNLQDEASVFLARAITKGKNSQIATQAALFTAQTGSTGVAMATSAFEIALQDLAAAGAPRPYNFVTGAKAIYGAKGITTKLYGLSSNEYALSSGTVSDDFSKTGLVSKTYGFNVYLDPGITDDATDIKGYFFSRDALCWGEQRAFAIDIDYIVSTRVHQYVATLWGGASIYIDSYGVEGTFGIA